MVLRPGGSTAGWHGATRTPCPQDTLPSLPSRPWASRSLLPTQTQVGVRRTPPAAGHGTPKTQTWPAGSGVTAPAAERTAKHSILAWSSFGVLNTEEIGMFVFSVPGFPHLHKPEVQSSCAGSADVLLQEQPSQSTHKPALEQMDT